MAENAEAWEQHRSVELVRILQPQVLLQRAARTSLQHATNSIDESRLDHCVVAMVMAALAVEAGLNFVGAGMVPLWKEEIERETSPGGKLIVLQARLGLTVDRSRRPFQSFRPMFKFRNSIVHAKREELACERTEDHSQDIPVSTFSKPAANWESRATLETATSYVEDAAAIVEALHKAAGLAVPGDEHSDFGVRLDPDKHGNIGARSESEE